MTEVYSAISGDSCEEIAIFFDLLSEVQHESLKTIVNRHFHPSNWQGKGEVFQSLPSPTLLHVNSREGIGNYFIPPSNVNLSLTCFSTPNNVNVRVYSTGMNKVGKRLSPGK